MLKPGVVCDSAPGVDGGREIGRQRSPSQRVPRLHFGCVRIGTQASPFQRVPLRHCGRSRVFSLAVAQDVPVQVPLFGHTQNSPFQTRPLVQAGAQRSPCRVWPSGHVCGGGGTLVARGPA